MSSTPPDFIYFDLGNILFRFCHERMLRQMAAVSAVEIESLRTVIFGPLGPAFDRGEVSPQGFYGRLTDALQVEAPFDALEEACSNIFEPIPETCALAAALQANGVRCGVLSNTNHSHWNFIQRKFPGALPSFAVTVLSYEVGSIKPQPEIYRRAAELAGADPAKILFFDDRPENVAAAREEGWDAVLIEDPQRIRGELLARGFGEKLNCE